jgi:dihydroxyacetone kinase
VLLIIKNYTGDRINFGQAALMAQAQGIKVSLVVVVSTTTSSSNKIRNL